MHNYSRAAGRTVAISSCVAALWLAPIASFGAAPSPVAPAATDEATVPPSIAIVQRDLQRLTATLGAVLSSATNATTAAANKAAGVDAMIEAVDDAANQLTDDSAMLKAVDAAIKEGQETMNDFKRKSVDATYSEETRKEFEQITKGYEPTLQSLYKSRSKLTSEREDLARCKKILTEKKDVISAYQKLGRLKELARAMEQCVQSVRDTVESIKALNTGIVEPPPKT